MGSSSVVLICSVVVGAAAGASLVFLVLRSQLKQSVDRCVQEREAAEKTWRERLAEKDAAITNLGDAKAEYERKVADLTGKLAGAEERAESAGREKRQLEQHLPETFAALAGRTLTENSDQFLKLAKESLAATNAEAKGELELKQQAIDASIKPVAENLGKLEKALTDLEMKRELAYSGIETQYKGLMACTGQLTNALQRPSVRGSWGELTLKTVLENAGLLDGHHFTRQDSQETEDGRLRADVVVRMPRKRSIALDAKTPFDSFRDAVNCEDAALRDGLFKKHAAAVRGHMKSLAGKKYWEQYEGLDCVIMFLPSEAMFYAALEHDNTLLEDARKLRVYLVNPTTLVALLSSVAYVLDQEKLNDSAVEISKIGRNLYDGIRTFGSHVARTGRNLESTVKAYNDSVKSLERSVISRARQLKQRGVGGEALSELDEVETLPIGFQSQEMLALPADPEPIPLEGLPPDILAIEAEPGGIFETIEREFGNN